MKAEIKVTKEVEIKTLHVKAEVRYWEDATINGESHEDGHTVPCKEGDLWCPIIDIDSGKILNWEEGKKADIHFKVCDAGNYYLKDEEGNTVLSREDNYVPDILCPKEPGYGDYIIMQVDESGQIQDWEPIIDDFYKAED